jgi:hypothetical protein
MGLHEVSVFDTEDSLTYAEAVYRPDSDIWLEAMRSKIQSTYDNTIWNLVAPPTGVKLIANKWVLKKKLTLMVIWLVAKYFM